LLLKSGHLGSVNGMSAMGHKPTRRSNQANWYSSTPTGNVIAGTTVPTVRVCAVNNSFYDELAESYHLIFDDWDAAIVRQRDVLARLFLSEEIEYGHISERNWIALPAFHMANDEQC
jgi:hypothetical protein